MTTNDTSHMTMVSETFELSEVGLQEAARGRYEQGQDDFISAKFGSFQYIWLVES